jgi:hypothetical protein
VCILIPEMQDQEDNEVTRNLHIYEALLINKTF